MTSTEIKDDELKKEEAKIAARSRIAARTRTVSPLETTVGANLPAPERSKPVAKVSRTAYNKADSPTRSDRRLSADELVRMSKPEVAAVAHQRGYKRIHTGTVNLRAVFLAAQAADQGLK